MWGVAAPDSLKSTRMTLLGVEGEAVCAATAPGEPAPAQHTAGRCSEIPRDLNSVPEDKWEGTAACQRRERPCRGKAKEKATEHLPLGFCIFLCHVTQRHA